MQGYVYIIRANGLYKIGSTRDLNRRFMELRTASPYLERVQIITCYAYQEMEKELHRIFANRRKAGEWFSLDNNDLNAIAATDWASFPTEVKARAEINDLYRRIVEFLRASPDIREILRCYVASKATC